jgi:hypothetical protein
LIELWDTFDPVEGPAAETACVLPVPSAFFVKEPLVAAGSTCFLTTFSCFLDGFCMRGGFVVDSTSTLFPETFTFFGGIRGFLPELLGFFKELPATFTGVACGLTKPVGFGPEVCCLLEE